MRCRPPLLEIAWSGRNGTSAKGKGYHVVAGFCGSYYMVSGPYRRKADCMKAVTAAAKLLAGHPLILNALGNAIRCLKTALEKK